MEAFFVSFNAKQVNEGIFNRNSSFSSKCRWESESVEIPRPLGTPTWFVLCRDHCDWWLRAPSLQPHLQTPYYIPWDRTEIFLSLKWLHHSRPSVIVIVIFIQPRFSHPLKWLFFLGDHQRWQKNITAIVDRLKCWRTRNKTKRMDGNVVNNEEVSRREASKR